MLAEDLPSITGDRIQLQQVILNLLRNASDAMAGVHDRPRQLVITTERDEGNGVRLSVRDAGVGVDPENINKLLEAFYTTKSDGMGSDSPSATPSSRDITAVCGQNRTTVPVPPSHFPFPSVPRAPLTR